MIEFKLLKLFLGKNIPVNQTHATEGAVPKIKKLSHDQQTWNTTESTAQYITEILFHDSGQCVLSIGALLFDLIFQNTQKKPKRNKLTNKKFE